MPECVYLGRRAGVEIVGTGEPLPIFHCNHPGHRTTTAAACANCGDRIETGCPEKSGLQSPVDASDDSKRSFGKTSIEKPDSKPDETGFFDNPVCSPPAFYRPTGPQNTDVQPIDLRGLYRGATCFVALGGPSMRQVPAYLLLQRGIIIASTNNNPAALPAPIRPHIWLHTDDCRKFHDSLWRDPSILKFTPTRCWHADYKRRGNYYKNIRRKVAGEFEPLGPQAWEMPNVIGYERSSDFNPDTWLHEPSVNRGNDKRSAARNHYPHVINTMFSILKLLYVLGFARVYLLGADFRMGYATPYAFGQAKNEGGVNGNNAAFKKMNSMFSLLKPRMWAAGFEVYNTTKPSGMTAFPYRGLTRAVGEVAGQFENQLDGAGWYE